MSRTTPAADGTIAQKYTSKSLERKLENKVALQVELGWPAEPKRAMICLPAGMTDALGGQLLNDVLPGILTLPVELVILGKGSSSYGTLFTRLVREHKHRIAIIPAKEAAIRAMYAAADIGLFLAAPGEQEELTDCLLYGAIPVSLPSPILEDYNPNQESGNAFLYEQENPWQCYGALVRSLETYRFPFDWRTIQKHCMETVRID